VGRPPNPGRPLLRDHRADLLGEHFDLSGFDELLERGTLQNVVGDLTSASQPEMQRLAAG
jgi:hypothetical protein